MGTVSLGSRHRDLGFATIDLWVRLKRALEHEKAVLLVLGLDQVAVFLKKMLGLKGARLRPIVDQIRQSKVFKCFSTH